MLINILLIIVGFVGLVWGADLLVKGASDIAKKFHIPELIIGLTIVAIGTSMPELIITITSAIKGHTDLIVGNVIGSNLCNLLFILGLISLIHPVPIDKETKIIHLPIAIFATILIMLMGTFFTQSGNFVISRPEGIIILVLWIMYFIYPIYIVMKDISETNKEEKASKHKSETNTLRAVFLLILGIALLKIGSDFVVENATSIAEMYNVSERVIGLTIIAIGTALPELVTSVVASLKKDTEMAIRKLGWFMCTKLMVNIRYWINYKSTRICSRI